MSQPSLSPHAQVLYAVLPQDGSAMGNIHLRNQFGWDEDYYLTLRDELEAASLIVRGKGRGGGISRKPAEPSPGSEE